MAPVTQAHREFRFVSPLGDDILLFSRMQGTERLSGLFEYELDLLSTDPSIATDKILGHGVTLKAEMPDGSDRCFNGIVSRFGQYGTVGQYVSYRATLRPWLWLLTRTTTCRIFQETNVPDIIKAVFGDKGFTDFDTKLSRTYPKREYCVQYRETDFNFVSRLMEEEGIYYFFEHTNGKHTLVLADSAGAHQPIPGYETLPFYEPTNAGQKERDYIYEWSFAREVQPVRYVLDDFDFKKPSTDLMVNSAVTRQHERAEYEVYDYPGLYFEHGDGEGYANSRIRELATQFQKISGRGNARGLYPGGLFTLSGHHRKDQNCQHLVESVHYRFESNEYFAAGSSGAVNSFECSFTAICSDQTYGPARVTPKPIVQGPQTAIVVGKSGEEIWTDQYGRVKVKFHWDRAEAKNETSSCWVRVSHPWAGKNWGMVAIPRMGQEVIVDFLEGDPDRPIITGRVYNAEQMPPYALPANATQTGILSRSSKGGSGANCNELRFEDKKGSEQVFLHAEKNQDIEVENDETHWVGHDRTKKVDHDEKTTVGHDRTESVGNNETISIGVNRTETVGSNETINIGANRTETVGQNETITVALTRTRAVGVNEAIAIGAAQEVVIGAFQTVNVGAYQNTNVGASRSINVGASQDVSIGANLSETVGSNQTVSVGKNYSETVGDNRSGSVGKNDSLKVGKVLAIEAGDEIVIKTGKSSITMKKDGTIQIEGKDITVKGSGEINAKASKDVVIKGKNVLQN